jgi:hypothetical protein
MTKGEDYQRRALAAEAHAEQSLGITRAHFLESAKQWHQKALEAGYQSPDRKPATRQFLTLRSEFSEPNQSEREPPSKWIKCL